MDQTDLLNDALGQAGGCSRITAIDDGSVSANHCLTFYPTLRDGLLRSHFWNFALKWVELAQDTPAPTIGYAYSYTLPGDFVRIKDYAGALPTGGLTTPLALATFGLDHSQLHHRRSGAALNDAQAFIQYLWRVENVALFDPLFIRRSHPAGLKLRWRYEKNREPRKGRAARARCY
jgi:hypothetical protein